MTTEEIIEDVRRASILYDSGRSGFDPADRLQWLVELMGRVGKVAVENQGERVYRTLRNQLIHVAAIAVAWAARLSFEEKER